MKSHGIKSLLKITFILIFRLRQAERVAWYAQ
jgi:hypothetical protein